MDMTGHPRIHVFIAVPKIVAAATIVFILTILCPKPFIHGQGHTEEPPKRFLHESLKHEINFPNEVTFTINGYSQVDLRQLTLNYQISESKVRGYIYSEIEQEIAGKAFSGVSTLSTSGNSYIPSGVRIRYYFEARDINGNRYKSLTKEFDYLNPEYPWRSTQVGPMTIFWHGFQHLDVAKSGEKAYVAIKEAAAISNLQEVEPFRAVIINNPREAAEAFPTVSSTSLKDGLYGGFAFRDYGVFLIGGIGADGLIHEGTHIVIGQAVDSPFSKMPAWLNEGLAMYFESSDHGRLAIAERAYLNGELMPLSSMGAVPGKPRDVRIFYAHSQAVVKHMIDKFGKAKMSRLITDLGNGLSIDTAIEKTYSMTLEDLDSDWKNGVQPTFERRLIVDPGTFWTSTMMGIAFIFAVTVTGINWLRKKISEPVNPADRLREDEYEEGYWDN